MVVDRTGALFGPLKAAADEWNRAAAVADGGVQTQPRFLPPRRPSRPETTRRGRALSDRVKRDEIFAFVEIPADALDPDTKSDDQLLLEPSRLPAAAVAGSPTTLNREILNAAVPHRVDRSRGGEPADAARRRLGARADRARRVAAASRPRRAVDRVRTTAIPGRHHDDHPVLGDVERAAAAQQRDRGEDEPHQRGPDRIDHAVPADDGQAARQRRRLGAPRRDLHDRRHRHGDALRLRRRDPDGRPGVGCWCSSCWPWSCSDRSSSRSARRAPTSRTRRA